MECIVFNTTSKNYAADGRSGLKLPGYRAIG
jgi:hypothetical protein